VIVPRAFSYSIITDPDLFYSLFEKPLSTIEFTKLKNGSSYERIKFGYETNTFIVSKAGCAIFGKDSIYFTGVENKISVRSDAFSDQWSFSVTDKNKPEITCEAVMWFNQGISAGASQITVTSTTGKSEAFALYTNKGFVGVVPDNAAETRFVFDNFSIVFSFETNFIRPSTTLNSTRSLIAHLYVEQYPSPVLK
jgi:hypothetical protein